MSQRRPNLTLLVNPTARGGRSLRRLPAVAGALAGGIPDVNLRVELSSSYTDAVARARRVVASAQHHDDGGRPDALVVMGGDGMASIGLNACANSECRLGVIPAGTGDDFARGMGLPRKTMPAVEAIIGGAERRVDVMETLGRLTGGESRRLVGSIVSTGYDAKVNYRVNNSKSLLGSFSYALAALAELARFEPLRYRLVIDGEERVLPAMLICVANAGYLGGGMWFAPQADVTDGALDVTIIHPVSRMTLIRLLPKTYSGKFVHDPAVERLRANEVSVDGDGMYAMADGELLGDVPIRMRALPGALHLLGRGD